MSWKSSDEGRRIAYIRYVSFAADSEGGVSKQRMGPRRSRCCRTTTCVSLCHWHLTSITPAWCSTSSSTSMSRPGSPRSHQPTSTQSSVRSVCVWPLYHIRLSLMLFDLLSRPLVSYGYSYNALCARPSFVIFDIRAFWRSVLSVRVPGCQKL